MGDGEVKIASGGGIVLIASLIDRIIRFAVTWLLSTSLGAGDFGVYTHAVTIVTVITVLSPLGLNSGAVYFGAQYAKPSKKESEKASFFSVLLPQQSVASYLLLVFGSWLPLLFDDPEPFRWIAPTIAIWTPLMFCVGLLTVPSKICWVRFGLSSGPSPFSCSLEQSLFILHNSISKPL